MWTITILAAAVFPGADEIVSKGPAPKLLIGKRFRQIVNLPQKQFDTQSRSKLRSILRTLSKQLQVGIVLDRRIDPTQPVEIHIKNKSLLQILQTIAKSCSAEAVVVDDYIYIAPENAAKAMNAESRKRSREMRIPIRKLPRRQRLKFTDRKTLHWNDLDEPRAIVLKIAEKYKLEVDPESAKLIPHDLWAGSTIPNARLVDQLSLILSQYDLTFQWGPRGKTIKIMSIEKPAKQKAVSK